MRRIDVIMITITALAVAVTLPTFRKGHTLDFGNTSDIISALCNCVVAGAAIYAASNAKGWFSQKSHTRGHEKAEDILSRIDVFYRARNQTLSETYQLHEFIVKISNNIDNHENKPFSFYDGKLKHFMEQVSNIDKISEDLDLMERWNISVVNKKVITDIIMHLRSFNVCASNTFNMAYICNRELNNKEIKEFESSFKLMKESYNELTLALHNIEVYYNQFKKAKFTDFFVIA